MSDYDDDFDGDNFDYDDDFDGYDSELSEEDHKSPQEGETNFVCIDASSLVPEKLLKCGHNSESVFCFLVRYKGYDAELDDWVPSSELPAHLVDEFYCSRLNMSPPVYDSDDCDTELDEDDGDYTPYVPLSQKQIKRQLREAGCYGKKVRRPVVSLPKTALQKLVGLIPSPQDPLTLEGVRAQVNRHRQRILRLSLLNERLQNYLKARARKKPPLRPPDPQVLSVHVPSSVSSCGSQSLGLFTPDHLSIVISEMSLGKAAPVSGDTGFGKPLDPP